MGSSAGAGRLEQDRTDAIFLRPRVGTDGGWDCQPCPPAAGPPATRGFCEWDPEGGRGERWLSGKEGGGSSTWRHCASRKAGQMAWGKSQRVWHGS